MNAAHQPDRSQGDPTALLLDYLDYYRAVVARKIAGLSDADVLITDPSGSISR